MEIVCEKTASSPRPSPPSAVAEAMADSKEERERISQTGSKSVFGN